MLYRQKLLVSNPELELVEVPLQGIYREALLTHYPKSKGIVGRRCLYSIRRGGEELGIIGATSSTMPIKRVVNLVYGEQKITKELKNLYAHEIINNNIFRLFVREQNLATKCLKLFRKKVYDDYQRKYNQKIKAIISLSYGVSSKGIPREGACFMADNWTYIGLSSGNKKVLDGGMKDNKFHVEKVEQKNIFLYIYKEKKRSFREKNAVTEENQGR